MSVKYVCDNCRREFTPNHFLHIGRWGISLNAVKDNDGSSLFDGWCNTCIANALPDNRIESSDENGTE